MWLPLALADVCRYAIAPYLKKEADLPKVSTILAGWCLPMLSRAVAANEDEAAALALFNSVKNLAERQAK